MQKAGRAHFIRSCILSSDRTHTHGFLSMIPLFKTTVPFSRYLTGRSLNSGELVVLRVDARRTQKAPTSKPSSFVSLRG
jgi:hypothetical protein